MNQRYSNDAFLVDVQHHCIMGLLPVKIANPTWNFSIEFRPPSSGLVHGWDFVVAPPVQWKIDWETIWWPKLVTHCRNWTTPTQRVRVVGGAHVTIEAGKYFPLSIPAYSGNPTVPPSPYYPLPSPYPDPVYCIPCGDKIYTA